jgi:hypothetical protein
MTGYSEPVIREMGRTTVKFRYAGGIQGKKLRLSLEEVFMLQTIRTLDALGVIRKGSLAVVPAVIDFARAAFEHPEVIRAAVHFYGWPNQRGGWTWVQMFDGKLPDKHPDPGGAAFVVLDAGKRSGTSSIATTPPERRGCRSLPRLRAAWRMSCRRRSCGPARARRAGRDTSGLNQVGPARCEPRPVLLVGNLSEAGTTNARIIPSQRGQC